MLKVTAVAKEELRNILKELAADPEMAVRLAPSPAKADKFQLALGKEQEGDQIVQSKDGKKILLIGPDMAQSLEEMVFDYERAPDEKGFIMRTSTPGS